MHAWRQFSHFFLRFQFLRIEWLLVFNYVMRWLTFVARQPLTVLNGSSSAVMKSNKCFVYVGHSHLMMGRSVAQPVVTISPAHARPQSFSIYFIICVSTSEMSTVYSCISHRFHTPTPPNQWTNIATVGQNGSGSNRSVHTEIRSSIHPVRSILFENITKYIIKNICCLYIFVK